MLIPSIDLQNGHVVQLVQGERLAIEAPDPEPWIAALLALSARAADRPRRRARTRRQRGDRHGRSAAGCPAASAAASAASSARARCSPPARTRSSPARRSFATARSMSAFARSLADAVGADRVIAAVDSRGGQVVIHGWKTALPITAVEAVRALEPYCARVPLHPRRQGRADAGHRHGRDPGRAPRHRRGASPPPAASRRGTRSTASTPPASTPSSAWRSIRGSCRWNARIVVTVEPF